MIGFLFFVFCFSVLCLLDSAAYYADRADKCAGAFYGGNGNAVAANLLFILAVIGWVGATCMTLFMIIKFTVGMRVSKEMEVQYYYHTIPGETSVYATILYRFYFSRVSSFRFAASTTVQRVFLGWSGEITFFYAPTCTFFSPLVFMAILLRDCLAVLPVLPRVFRGCSRGWSGEMTFF